MDKSLTEVLVRLSRDAASAAFGAEGEAAAATGGVPVQSDMGGVTLLTPLGEVLLYDPEQRTSAPILEPRWRRAALVKAARKFPELAAIFPTKPDHASTCPQCGGSGKMFGFADCGVCMGTGWVET